MLLSVKSSAQIVYHSSCEAKLLIKISNPAHVEVTNRDISDRNSHDREKE